MPDLLAYEPFALASLEGEEAPLTPIQEEILELKEKRNAVILAHNYQIEPIQRIADFVGDSLGLAYQAAST
ncbi:MAG: quinolinate synthase NadA, partial [Opitutaceae bacterium]|nr:quinolinate synthase NadA [Opitutaceae bacterium]